METQQLQIIYKYLKDTYKEYNISYRKSPDITGSYDFAIDTGISRIILKISRKIWDDHNSEKTVQHLEGQQIIIRKALLDNQNASFLIN